MKKILLSVLILSCLPTLGFAEVTVIDTIWLAPKAGNGLYPEAIGVNPVTNRIYVANRNSDNVSVIDGVTDSVVATIGVGNLL